jgi:uncharacterized protein YyaL (SSP411 family)
VDLGLHAATYFLALDRHLGAATHFVVVGEAGDPLAGEMHRAALASYAPRRVVQRLTPADAAGRALPPPLAAMVGRGAAATGYACRGTQCSAPAATLDEWLDALRGPGAAVTLGGRTPP